MEQKNREHWKSIDGYDNYEVSDCGRVRNVSRGRILSHGYLNEYPRITLSKDNNTKNYFIHRLVAFAFIDNPNNYQHIDHINHNRKDNGVHNLRWVSDSKNQTHRNKAKNNTSGIIGVCKKSDNTWNALWHDDNYVQHKKSFYIPKYGEAKAKELAINTRKRMMQKYEKYHEEIGAVGQVS